MNNKILIGVIVLLCVAIGAVAFKIITYKIAFEPDETIAAEFCRQLINRAQLKEITGYEKDAFVFRNFRGDIYPLELTVEKCDIKINERIIIAYPITPISYDEFYVKATEKLAEAKEKGLVLEEIKKIQNIEEKAFSFSVLGNNVIGFLNPDTNQVVKIIITDFNHEIALNIAKQIKTNVGIVPKLYKPEELITEQTNIILTGAEVILAESIQNTLGLNSFAVTGDGVLEIKNGEIVLFNVAIKDGQFSMINPFDFADQDSDSVFTYSILMNFSAIANFIEKISTPEELEELRATGEMLGIDILTTMRALGEANISVTMEMKSIDFDSYTKIVEIKGLKEIVTNVGGVFLAEMVMGEIEANLGVWQKTPADPVIVDEMTVMFEDMQNLILTVFDAYYVKEVLPNTQVERSVKGEDLSSSPTKVNGTPVYNFVTNIDLDKAKNIVISFISLFAEKAEIDIKEKERIITEINKNWPEIVKVIEAMETDSRIYICQKTRFTIKETGSVNMNLYELVAVLEPIIRKTEIEVTPEEEIEFARMKEAIKNMSIVGTMNVVYSDHNTVPAILPPAEYEVITPEPTPMPMW